MAKINIDDAKKELYYEQFVKDFYELPRLVRNACGDALVLPLLFNQIKQDYEFVRRIDNTYEFISNGKVIANMDNEGFKTLLLPALRCYEDNASDYVLGTNWMGQLHTIKVPNLETSANGFLRYAFALQNVYAPKWCVAGNYTLFPKDKMLSVLDAPYLRKAGKNNHPLIYAVIRQNKKNLSR